MTKFLDAKPCNFKLRFSPYAWAKLLYLRDVGDTEVGMYGITSTEDPMLITDVKLVKQKCTSCTVELDTEDSVQFVDRMLDQGLAPWQCQNIWIHTHPGNCPEPSGTDEDNFNKNFSHPHWAIFFILAKGGQTWCEVQFNVGPTCHVVVEHSIIYGGHFQGSDEKAWQTEYEKNVTKQKWDFTEYKKSTTNYTMPKKYQKDDELFASMEHASEDCPNNDLHSVAAWLSKCGFNDQQIVAYEEHSLGCTGLSEDLMSQDWAPCWSEHDDEDAMGWEDGKVWYWDLESDEFYQYDPKKDRFYVHSTGCRYKPKKGELWVDKVRAFAKKGNKQIITTV